MVENMVRGKGCRVSPHSSENSKGEDFETLDQHGPDVLHWIPLWGASGQKKQKNSIIIPQPLREVFVVPTIVVSCVVQHQHIPIHQKTRLQSSLNKDTKLGGIILFGMDFMVERRPPPLRSIPARPRRVYVFLKSEFTITGGTDPFPGCRLFLRQ